MAGTHQKIPGPVVGESGEVKEIGAQNLLLLLHHILDYFGRNKDEFSSVKQ